MRELAQFRYMKFRGEIGSSKAIFFFNRRVVPSGGRHGLSRNSRENIDILVNQISVNE